MTRNGSFLAVLCSSIEGSDAKFLVGQFYYLEGSDTQFLMGKFFCLEGTISFKSFFYSYCVRWGKEG